MLKRVFVSVSVLVLFCLTLTIIPCGGETPSVTSDPKTALEVPGVKSVFPTPHNCTSCSGTVCAQQTKLTASDGAAGDGFGCSVSLSGDGSTALVGSYYKYNGVNGYPGAAYVFTRSGTGWSQQTEVTASNSAASINFGYSVSLNSDGSTATGLYQ